MQHMWDGEEMHKKVLVENCEGKVRAVTYVCSWKDTLKEDIIFSVRVWTGTKWDFKENGNTSQDPIGYGELLEYLNDFWLLFAT